MKQSARIPLPCVALAVFVAFALVTSAPSRAAQKPPSRYLEAINAAVDALQKKDFPEARTKLAAAERAAITADEVVDVRVLQGYVEAADNKPEREREILNQALQIPYASATALTGAQLVLGQSYARTGNLDEARSQFRQAQSIKGISDFEQYMALSEIAKTYRSEGKAQLALAELRKTFKIQEATPVTLASAQLSIGEVLLEANNFADAREELSKVFQFDTGTEAKITSRSRSILEGKKQKAQLGIGRSYFLEKNYAKSREEYQKVLVMPSLTPKNKREAEKQLKAIDEAEKATAPAETEEGKAPAEQPK